MRSATASLLFFVGCATAHGAHEPSWADDAVYDRESEARAGEQYLRECARYANSPILRPAIDSSDGIDRCEAKALADDLFSRQGIGCGGAGSPVEAGAYWVVPVRVGMGGEPAAPIRIERRTGETTEALQLAR